MNESDIKNGVRNDGTSCPIALAIKRRLPTATNVNVSDLGIWVDGDYVFTPVRAEHFVHRFDKGREVQPFRFELRI